MWTQERHADRRKNPVPFMNTLSACLSKAAQEGYKETFRVTNRGLYSVLCSRYYRPEQVSIVRFYRFEGESDPGDNAIMYMLETSDGLKGTLVDAYGAYSDNIAGHFLNEVHDIQKRMKRHDQNIC